MGYAAMIGTASPHKLESDLWAAFVAVRNTSPAYRAADDAACRTAWDAWQRAFLAGEEPRGVVVQFRQRGR